MVEVAFKTRNLATISKVKVTGGGIAYVVKRSRRSCVTYQPVTVAKPCAIIS